MLQAAATDCSKGLCFFDKTFANCHGYKKPPNLKSHAAEIGF
jgi:hypothetical protein